MSNNLKIDFFTLYDMINTSPSIYFHTKPDTFEEKIKSLLIQMIDKQRIVSLSFFGASSEENYEAELTEIKSAVSLAFDGRMPLISYIVQSLGDLDGMGVEVLCIPHRMPLKSVVYKTFADVRYAVLEWGDNKALMIEGVRAKSTHDSVTVQCDQIFQKIETILSDENIGLHEIVRQWNYIGKITDTNNAIQNYQAFNDARARFYSKTNWAKFGYPAATGIGMAIDGIIVSLMAVSSKSDIRITPIDNPLQIAAHLYSQSMLVGQKKNATPKFERAKLVQDGSVCICFISGTAAIRGEQSMLDMSAASQTRQTIENIKYLISEENLKRHGIADEADLTMSALRVYIKNMESFKAVKTEVEKVWSEVPVIYVQADICRYELQVEIEGIAMRVK